MFIDIKIDDIEKGEYFTRIKHEEYHSESLRTEVEANIKSNNKIKEILKIFYRVQNN
jgi:hypothetical protein